MLTTIILVFIINSCNSNFVLNGNFKECIVQSHQNMLQIEKCPDMSFRENINHDAAVENRKEGEAIVFSKHQYVLEGIGQECSIKVRTFKLSTDLFWNRYTEHNEHYVKLTRFECLNMIKNQICNGKQMICKSTEQCIYIEERNAERDVHPGWFGTHVFTLHECKFSNRLLISDSFEKNVLQGSVGSCLVNDLYCELSKSIVIWDEEIIRKCLFERIMYIKDLTSVRDTNRSVLYYYSYDQSLFFKVQSNKTSHKDCGGYEFISTSEGLFLSLVKQKGLLFANETRNALYNIPESKVKNLHLHDSELRKILMSQDDFAFYKLLKMNLVSTCSAFLNIIKSNQNNDDTFVFLNEMGYANDLIIYFDDGVSYMPICNDVYNITIFKQQKTKDSCFEDIQILYKNEKSQKYRRGFLRKNGIITQTSKKISCELSEYNDKAIMIADVLIQRKLNEISLINYNHSVKTVIRTSLWNSNELQRLFDHNSYLTNGSNFFENIEMFNNNHFDEDSNSINDLPIGDWDEDGELGFFGSIIKSIKNVCKKIWDTFVQLILFVILIFFILCLIYFFVKFLFAKLGKSKTAK